MQIEKLTNVGQRMAKSWQLCLNNIKNQSEIKVGVFYFSLQFSIQINIMWTL